MSKIRVDEGLMKYIVKLFFPQLEREIVQDPEIQQLLRDISKSAARINASCDRLEELTGKDLSDLKFKRK